MTVPRQPMPNRGHVGDLFWHVHHDQLAEVLTEPIKARVDYINTQKPERERATRLRWMEPVLTLDDPAVADLYRAWAALRRTRVDWEQVRADYERAWDDYARAWSDYNRAWSDYDRTVADYERAWADWDRAWSDYNRAWSDYDRARVGLRALHATEHPGCPWDGQTLVFPEETS